MELGDFGHLSVVVSQVTAVLSAVFYFLSVQNKDNLADSNGYKLLGRSVFVIHGLAVFGIVASLYSIIYQHRYEYHYAWSHSSNFLPWYYMISAFWEGQEGSFLLWIFWHVILASVFLFTNRQWEAPFMAVFMAVQIFLCSMILGVVIGDLKIGNSPFLLLQEVFFDNEAFINDPNFVPEEGSGLNPLLQNYWMVIHPPTLFLGFAFTLVPFAFCIAGMWQRKFHEWIAPALPWTLAGALVLGTGILMGGYWAYETLNFGGYWNWDPVENAVYVPWLIMVGSLHTMILFKKNQFVLRTNYILVVTTFLLILYSTFLTRSGVLGESSVHSFTDLGLSGQLLIYLGFFFVIALVMLVVNWKNIPGSKEEITVYNKEFWIMAGILTFAMSSFQVLVGTSIPVFNKIFGLFGLDLNMAPPIDQIGFYSKFQIWAAVLITLFGGIAQTIWWSRVDTDFFKSRSKKFILSMIVFLAASIAIILLVSGNNNYFQIQLTEIETPGSTKTMFGFMIRMLSYFLLLAFSLFSIFASSSLIKKLFAQKDKLGGAISHIGIAVMMIGILFSSGYDKVISLNRTGAIISKDATTEFNAENLLLKRHKPIDMGGYTLTYKGNRKEFKGYNGYIDFDQFLPIDNNHAVITKPVVEEGDTIVSVGDTVVMSFENTFYEIEFKENDKYLFTLYPRAQVNESMGLLASPDIKRFIGSDFYSHVSSIQSPDTEVKWGDTTYTALCVGDTFFMNDFVAVLDTVNAESKGGGDYQLYAEIRVLTNHGDYVLSPGMYIQNMDEVNYQPHYVQDIGVKAFLLGIGKERVNGLPTFRLAHIEAPMDYVVLKVIQKPLIGFLWIGTLIVILGFSLAMSRRIKEYKKGLLA